jgi:hypothetical protein
MRMHIFLFTCRRREGLFAISPLNAHVFFLINFAGREATRNAWGGKKERKGGGRGV